MVVDRLPLLTSSASAVGPSQHHRNSVSTRRAVESRSSITHTAGTLLPTLPDLALIHRQPSSLNHSTTTLMSTLISAEFGSTREGRNGSRSTGSARGAHAARHGQHCERGADATSRGKSRAALLSREFHLLCRLSDCTALSSVALPLTPRRAHAPQRATKKRKSVVHESQDDVDETENFEAFGEEDMPTGLELPTLELWADDRPPHEMVTSAKNGKVWVDDGLLKPTELTHFFTILGLCRDWLIRLAIAAHVEQLDRDGFVAFAKDVLRFAGNRVSKMALNRLKIKTRSDPAKPPVGLENKLRGRGQSSVFRELQPDGTFRSVTTWRPMYTTCVQLELQNFLREFTPGDSEDCVLLEPIFDRGLYVQLCERW